MRVKLDLSEFLEDERRFSVVKLKEKQAKTVRDVLIKIAELFNVDVGIEESGKERKKGEWEGGDIVTTIIII